MKALISVSDKTGIVEFAKELESIGVEIISTGGTYKKLKENANRIRESFIECGGAKEAAAFIENKVKNG